MIYLLLIVIEIISITTLKHWTSQVAMDAMIIYFHFFFRLTLDEMDCDVVSTINDERSATYTISTLTSNRINKTSDSLALHWHILIISSFIFICLTGNGITIYVHLKSPNKYKTKVYIISLACIDIFACVTFLPMYPFFDKTVDFSAEDDLFIKLFFFLHMGVAGAYNSIVCFTALDRLIAVRFPFEYTKYYKTRTYIVFTLVAVFSLYSGAIAAFYKNHATVWKSEADLIIELQTFLIWMVMILLYVFIIYYLYKQGRHIRMAVSQKTELNLNLK